MVSVISHVVGRIKNTQGGIFNEKITSVILCFVIVFSICSVSFAAESPMTFEEAKAYLENYYVTKVNSAGKEYTVQYIFDTENDLNSAAQYISDNGLTAFNMAIEESVGEETRATQRPRTTNPTNVYKSISGNGNHNVSAMAYGLASFDTLGGVEYLVELSYTVTVTNGAITALNDISFNVSDLSTGGGWGNTRFPSYYTDTSAGVAANYDITMTVEIGIADFSFELKTETDNEIFALITTLQQG